MIKPVTFWQRALVYFICWTFNIQPLLANVIVDNSQHNTSVNRAGNGVEVVNIATPNASGLSHNQYQQFNVDPSGLILNNSTAQVAQSQLGGYLQNNPNLHGQAATVILNEVTGASRSQLQGYTEVFGQGAPVILTNPYGITCNGCGFINTPRVTLSTGNPLIENGNVTGFDVSQGSVSIEGLGLDATHQSYFDIITRTAQLNADIHANDLSIVTGKNRVSYQSNQVTATTADDKENPPELAIDSSNLGGMYAGRIALVATDAGVGVNVGNLSASQGDIRISADGQITLGKSSAQNNLTVSSQSDVTLKGSQYAGQTASLSGQNIHVDSDTLAAGQNVSLTATDTVTLNQSLVEAGVDADGKQQAGGVVDVQANDLTLNASNLIAGQQLTTAVNNITVDHDSLIYGQEMTLNQLSKLDNSGTVAATDQLSVKGTDASLVGHGNITASDITMDSDRLTLDTHITAQTLAVQARQNLTTGEQSEVSATDKLTVTAGTLNQQGQLTTSGDMEIDAADAILKGHVAAQNLRVKAQRLTQESGTLQAGQTLNITGDTVTLSGASAGKTSVGIDAGQLTLNGTLQSGGDARLTVGGKMQTGDQSQLVTQGSLQATVGTLTQRGKMQSGEDVTLTGHTLKNEGLVSAVGNTHLTAQAQLTNRGTVTSGLQLAINAGAMVNSGELSAQQDVAVTVAGQLDNQTNGLISGQVTTVQAGSVNNAGQLQSLTDLGLTADALNNSGTLAALSDATLNVTNYLTNRGTVSAAHDVRLLTDNLTNSGQVIASDNLLIAKDLNQTRNTSLNNTGGSLDAGSGHLTIATQGDLQVSAGQHLFAGKNLTITAATLNNSGEIAAQNKTRLTLDGVTTAQSVLTNQTDGLITGQTTSIDAQSVANHGQLQALEDLGLTATSLANSGTLTALNTTLAVHDHLLNTGTVSAVENVSLLADQVDNQGRVSAGAHLLIAADQDKKRSDSLNNAGRFETRDGDIEIVTDTVTQQSSGHIIAGHDLRLDGNQLENAGELAATGKTALTLHQQLLNQQSGLISGQVTAITAQSVNNQGQLQSLSDLGLTAESFGNSGVLAALDNTSLHISHDLTSSGSILAGHQIVLNAEQLDNRGRVSAGDAAIATTNQPATGQDDSLIVTADTLTNSGELLARGRNQLTLNTQLTNQTDGLISGQTTTVSAQSVTNRGQLQSLSALGLTADALINSGTLAALSDMTLNVAHQLSNSGAVSANHDVSLLTDNLTNTGKMFAGNNLLIAKDTEQTRTTTFNNTGGSLTAKAGQLTIATHGDVMVSSGQHLSAGQDVILQANSLTNDGEVAAQGNTALTLDNALTNHNLVSGQKTTITAQSVTNTGQLQSLTDLGLTTDVLDNSGTLAAFNHADLTVADRLLNRGAVLAGNNIQLNAARMENQGRVSAGEQAMMTPEQRAAGQTDASLSVTADTLTNSGELLAQGSNQLTINAQLTNLTGGLISGQTTTVNAPAVTNAGQLQSLTDLGLTTDALDNSGTLAALSDMTLNVAHQLSNSGAVSANHDVSLLSDNLTNTGKVFAGNNLLIAKDSEQTRTATFNNTDGSLTAKAGQLTIATHGDVMISSGQHLTAGQDMILQANSLTNNGEVAAQGNTSLTLDNALINHGLVSGQRTMITAQSVTNTDQLQSLSDLGLTADALDNSGTLAALSDMTLNVAHQLSNSGAVSAKHDVSLLTDNLTNTGEVFAGNNLLVAKDTGLTRTATFNNTDGSLTAKAGQLTIATYGDVVVSRGQHLTAGQDLILQANSLTNNGEVAAQGKTALALDNALTNHGLVSGQQTTLVAQSVTNTGQLQSLTDLGLNADTLANSGTLAALSDMTLNVAHQLSNSGTVSANHDVSLLTDNLTNAGQVFAGNNLLIAKDTGQTRTATFNNTDGSLTAKAGQLTIATYGDVVVSRGQHLTAGQDVTLQANGLTNDGEVAAQGNTLLTLDNALINHGLVSGQKTTLIAQSVTNTGQMQSLTDLGLTTDALDNSGTLAALSDIMLNVALKLSNRGTVSANHDVSLLTDNLTNTGKVFAGNNLLIAKDIEQTRTATFNNTDGSLTAKAGQLTIATYGDVVVSSGQHLTAGQDMILQANSLTNDGEVAAQGNTLLTLDNALINHGLVSGQQTTLVAQSVTNTDQLQSLTDLGLTADALDNSGTLAALSDMTLNVAHQLSNSGAVSANHDVSLLTDNLTNTGKVFAGNNLLVAKDTEQTRTATFNNTDGSLTAKAGQLTIATHGDVVVSRGQHLTAGQDVTLQANSLTNDGEVAAQGNTSLTLDNALTNHGLVSGQQTTLIAQSVTNTGQMQSLTDLGLTTDALDNSGTLAALSDMTLNVAHQLSNSGAVSANHDVSLLTDNLTNTGKVFAGNNLLVAKDTEQTRTATFNNTDGSLTAKAGQLTIATHGDVVVSHGQHLTAGQDVTLQANSLTNDGEVAAQGNTSLTLDNALTNHGLVSGQKTTITAQSVTNTDQLQSLTDLGLTADALDNSGILAALSDMTLNVAHQLSNSGAVSANHDVSLLTDNLTNTGKVFAGNNLLIAKDTGLTRTATFNNTDGSLTAKAGQLTIATYGDVVVSSGQHLTAGQDMILQANSLTNDGEVAAQGNTSLTLDNALTNHGLVSGQQTTLVAQSVTNTGQLQSLTDLGLNADTLANSGTLAALSDMTLNVAHQLSNSGTVSANHDVSLLTDNLTNSGKVFAGNNLLVAKDTGLTRTATFNNTDGSLTAKAGQLTIATHGDVVVSRGQHLTAGQDLILQANSLTNDGEVAAQGNTSLALDNTLTNHGLVSGQGTTMTAQSVNNTGQMQALTDLGLNADVLANSGTLVAGNNAVFNIIHTLTSNGNISAGNNASLLADQVNNQNKIYARNSVLIAKDSAQTRSSSLTNSGQIDAKHGSISIATHGDFTVSAGQHISAGKDLTLVADALTNDGELSSQGITTIGVDGTLTNHSSGIISGQNTVLRAGATTNQGQLQALNDLNLTTGSLTNSGSVVALHDMTLNATGHVDNQSLLYAGHDSNLFSDSLTNYSDIVVGNDLLIARDSNKTRSRNLTNSSGSIESLGGNIGIYADTVLNKRTVLDVTSQTQDLRGSIPGGGSSSFTRRINYLWGNLRSTVTLESEPYSPVIGVWTVSPAYGVELVVRAFDSGKTISFKAYQEGLVLKDSSQASIIKATNGLIINANDVQNLSSSLLGRNISIFSQSLSNVGYKFNTTEVYFDYALPDEETQKITSCHMSEGSRCKSGFTFHYNLVNTRKVEAGTTSILLSAITATNTLNLKVQNRTNNSVIGINAVGTQPTKSAHTTRATQGASGTQAEVQTTQYTPGTGQGVVSTQDVSDSAQSLQTAQGAGTAQGAQVTQGSADTSGTIQSPSLQTTQGGGTAEGVQVTQGPSDTSGTIQSPSLQTAQGGGTAQGVLATQEPSETSGTVQAQSATTHGIQLTSQGSGSGAAVQAGQTSAGSGLAAQSAPNLPSVARATPQGKSATTVTLSNSSTVTAPTVNLPNQNRIPFPDYRLPTSPHGLFVFSDGPQSDYLIATNPAVTNLNDFLGSDYFKDQLNYDPERKEKFLGDAYYDTRTITQEIFEQTGKRYLNEDIGSDLAQMKQLIDSAAQEKTALNLKNGVALTDEQIARLSHDIIWYEPIEVNGQTVMAPKLYLSSASQDNISNGALLAGRNVNVTTGDFANSGAVAAREDLSIASRNGISNTHGTLSANDDLALIATGDIVNRSGVISGGNVQLKTTSGSVVNETLVNKTDYGNGFVHTEVDPESLIQSRTTLGISAGKDIVSQGATIRAGEGTVLLVGGDVTFGAVERETQQSFLDGGTRQVIKDIVHLGSTVSSGGDLTIQAGNNFHATASDLSAQGTLILAAGHDITLDTAVDTAYRYSDGGGHTRQLSTTTNQGSNLSGRDVLLQSGNDTTLVNAGIQASGNVALNAKGDVNILAANDSRYEYSKSTHKKSFGRSKTTIHESLKETVRGSSIAAGGDITIKAQKYSNAKLANGHSDIQVVGSNLNAGDAINLSADGDVILSAQQYREYQYNQTIKKGFGGLSGSNRGNLDDATLLEGANTIAASHININSGKNIGVIASTVSAGGDVNMQALDEVLVTADNILRQTQQWDEKSSFLSGGHLMEMSSDREGMQSSTAQGSQIASHGNVNIQGGSVALVGSDVVAGENTVLKADTGHLDIRSAQNSLRKTSQHKQVSVDFPTFELLSHPESALQITDGQVRFRIGKATYDQVENQTTATTQTGSTVLANNDVSLSAAGDLTVTGSRIAADQDGSGTGDLSLAAENILIQEAKETEQTQSQEVHGKAEASLVVQHQAVEVEKAVKGLQQATQALKQAKQDYQQYKKQLASLKGTLETLQADYAAKKPGVTFEDIEELQDLVSDLKGDEAWYAAGIALAAENVTSKTTLLYKQNRAAVNSITSGAFGFDAGLHLDIDADKQNSQSQRVTSVGSQLSGQNVTIEAGHQTGQSATVQGSVIHADDTLAVSGNQVNLLASDEQSSNTNGSESAHVGASVTLFGANSGVNLDASYSRNESVSQSQTHTNSVLSADHIRITSDGDTDVNGADVAANEQLDISVGGDLNVASVQNRYSSTNHGGSVSGGVGLSGGDVGKGGAVSGFDHAGNLQGVNSGVNLSNGRSHSRETMLTRITSGGDANITVGGNTDIKGATIATVNEDGSDAGRLHLETGTLSYTDLSNTRDTSSRNAGVSSSVSIGPDKDGATQIDASRNSSRYQYTNQSGYHKSKTLATVGQGVLRIEDTHNSDDTERLNRDITSTTKDLYSVDRQQGNFDVTVDHRLLSETGWKEIAEDALITDMMRESLERAITTDRVELTDILSETGKQLDIYKSVKQAIIDDPQLAARLRDPKLSADTKQVILDQLTHAAMQSLGYNPEGYENKIIAKDNDARKGFYSEETQKSYINDQNANNTEELVLIAGHEMSHAVDDKTGDVNRYSEQDREIYANNIGEDFTDYTDTALGVTGNGSMASRNSHVGNTGSTVAGNNQVYSGLDKRQGDNLIPLVIPAAVAITSITAAAIADPKVQQVTKQALTDAMAGAKEVGNGILNFFEPDAQYTDEELDIAANAYLQMQEYRDSSTDTGDWVEMDNLMQQVSPEVVARAHTMSAQNKEIAETIPMPGGSEIVEGTATVLTNPVGESIDASSVTVAGKDQGMWTTETPADHGVDVPLVMTSENANGDSQSSVQGENGKTVGDKPDNVANTPLRSVNDVSIPNPAANELLTNPTPRFLDRIADVRCIDCDDLARDFYKASGENGQILDLTVPNGEIKVRELDNIENFVDHRVYTDGNFVFDPRFSKQPVPVKQYMDELKLLNPDLIIKDITPE